MLTTIHKRAGSVDELTPKNLFEFWFAGGSEQQYGENWTPKEVRSTRGMTFDFSSVKPFGASRSF